MSRTTTVLCPYCGERLVAVAESDVAKFACPNSCGDLVWIATDDSTGEEVPWEEYETRTGTALRDG